MKLLCLTLLLTVFTALTTCEPLMSKRPLIFHHWPTKNSKQLSLVRNPAGKQRTLVVQIRSDQPVPLVLKGRTHAAAHGHGHLAHLHHATSSHHGRPMVARPIKLSAPALHLKSPASLLRKPLKLKLADFKIKPKPSLYGTKPFQYELPTTTAPTASIAPFSHFIDVQQQLPLDTHAHFIPDHFTPIHTIPAPNLAPLHDNHIHHDEEQHHLELQHHHLELQHHHHNHHPDSQYQVTEDDVTNDHTILDPHSGAQKLFAPDPDPALPTAKIRPAVESYNQPSNNKPLPADVQSNYLPPVAQPLVQIVGATQAQQLQHPAPEIYPIQLAQSQPVQLQTFGGVNVAAPIPAYSPAYLVTQSNNLYTQHQQQLFQPAAAPLVASAAFADADLTQEVASNGQILQAAKDPHSNALPVLDGPPQFAALIAAPALSDDHHQQQHLNQQHLHQHQQVFDVATPLRLPNVAASSDAASSGFVVSNFFGNAQDSSQLLQSYAEEERLQQEEQEQQLLLQQQHNHLIQLQQQQQQQLQQQQKQQLYAQQQQIQQQQIQLHQQVLQPRQPQHVDPAAVAFEEHQPLVQQQLGDSPLRIFVPDDELDVTRIKKRSDHLKEETEEDATSTNEPPEDRASSELPFDDHSK